MKLCKDISGKTIKVGDFVVYAADSSLNYGRVLGGKKLKKSYGAFFKDMIQVRTVYESYKGFSKNTVNLNPYMRFLVIKKSAVPTKLRKGFDES